MRPEKVPSFPLYVARGASEELSLSEQDPVTGEFANFAGPVTMRITLDSGVSFTLAEGSGITVDAEDTPGVARGTIHIQLSVAQSRQIPAGNFASHEIQEAAAGGEQALFIGRVIGQGGNNPDV